MRMNKGEGCWSGWVTLIISAMTLLFASGALAITYEYDELYRLKRVLYDNGATITYEYDASGNIISVTTTVPDTTPPVLSLPGDMTRECAGPQGAEVTFSATAMDEFDGEVPVTCNPTSGSAFPFGATQVSCSATDKAENAVTGTFTVTINDTTGPLPDVAYLPEVRGQCSAEVTSVPSSTDICAGKITATTSDPLSYTKQGTYTVTWTYTDGSGNTTSQTQTVIVQDVTAPVPDLVLLPTVTGECSATITSPPMATDACAGKITGTTSDPLTYTAQGIHTVTWIYQDRNGNSSTQTQTVEVKDVTSPQMANVKASPDVLWPPTHKMVKVAVKVNASDNCEPNPICKITSVSSNEPIDGLGDGDTAPDWEITGNLTVNLRAERSGAGSGRVYTINVMCADAVGNSSIGTVTVNVPHDKGKK